MKLLFTLFFLILVAGCTNSTNKCRETCDAKYLLVAGGDHGENKTKLSSRLHELITSSLASNIKFPDVINLRINDLKIDKAYYGPEGWSRNQIIKLATTSSPHVDILLYFDISFNFTQREFISGKVYIEFLDLKGLKFRKSKQYSFKKDSRQFPQCNVSPYIKKCIENELADEILALVESDIYELNQLIN
jgi:hypothetical protein